MALAIERPAERYRSAASRLERHRLCAAGPAAHPRVLRAAGHLALASQRARTDAGVGNYVELLGSTTYLRIFVNTFVVVRGGHRAFGADRLSGRVDAGDHAPAMGERAVCGHPAVDVDEPAGADLCLDGASAAHRRHQQDADESWPDRPAAAAGQQSDRRDHRHDLHHAALRHLAAARRYQSDRSVDPAGGVAVRATRGSA